MCKFDSVGQRRGTASAALERATLWRLATSALLAGAGGEDLVMFLGVDPNGVALEVMAIELEDVLLIIHAMKLRPKYRVAFRVVMGQRP